MIEQNAIFLFRDDIIERFRDIPDEDLDIPHFNVDIQKVKTSGVTIYVGNDYTRVLKNRYSSLGVIVPVKESVG